MELTAEQKEKYRSQLQRDDTKDFTSEFNRTTDLELSIIDEHGFEGIKLIHEDRNSSNYFPLGSFPENCPWFSLNKKDIPDFIDENFQSIKNEIPEVLEAMKDRCRFIYAEKTDSSWQLHYLMDIQLYDGRDYFRIYIGGAPNANPTPNENLKKFNWSIPRDLARLYAIHDGFGEADSSGYVMSSEDIRVMGEMMNPICKKQDAFPEDYNFNNLLEFSPDGAGNCQCFYRKDAESDNNSTVDWDHEVWEISEEEGFYEFINRRLSELDEE